MVLLVTWYIAIQRGGTNLCRSQSSPTVGLSPNNRRQLCHSRCTAEAPFIWTNKNENLKRNNYLIEIKAKCLLTDGETHVNGSVPAVYVCYMSQTLVNFAYRMYPCLTSVCCRSCKQGHTKIQKNFGDINRRVLNLSILGVRRIRGKSRLCRAPFPVSCQCHRHRLAEGTALYYWPRIHEQKNSKVSNG